MTFHSVRNQINSIYDWKHWQHMLIITIFHRKKYTFLSCCCFFRTWEFYEIRKHMSKFHRKKPILDMMSLFTFRFMTKEVSFRCLWFLSFILYSMSQQTSVANKINRSSFLLILVFKHEICVNKLRSKTSRVDTKCYSHVCHILVCRFTVATTETNAFTKLW